MRCKCTVLAIALMLAGCSRKEDNNPAPSSSLSRELAQLDALAWAVRAPDVRTTSLVAPTGSMLPLFGSNAVLLLERATARDLRVGDIAIYDDGKKGICHRVRAINERYAVLFTGDNNDGTQPDGWIAAERIRYRVAGILYAKKT